MHTRTRHFISGLWTEILMKDLTNTKDLHDDTVTWNIISNFTYELLWLVHGFKVHSQLVCVASSQWHKPIKCRRPYWFAKIPAPLSLPAAACLGLLYVVSRDGLAALNYVPWFLHIQLLVSLACNPTALTYVWISAWLQTRNICVYFAETADANGRTAQRLYHECSPNRRLLSHSMFVSTNRRLSKTGLFNVNRHNCGW
jgi:hypothetical protein